ncbi:hypothetical protein ABFT80_11985 [Mesorhizobium sp. SB112]|uniref:hypothetical protein n=1 Tax=Mesorhizobium sp. SB112 TaxID=3151853 RepID=UPI0032667FAA
METKPRHLHIFISSFATKADALGFSQEQWEPEPGENVSEEEYKAWEDRNPIWAMEAELGCGYLDSDMIETIWGTDGKGLDINWTYLTSLIGPECVEQCKTLASSVSNTLIIIDETALGGFDFVFHSTPTMNYCGSFRVRGS